MPTGREKTLLRLLVLTEVDLTAPDVIQENGIVDIRANARLLHLLDCRDGHHQSPLVVALDEQEFRETSGTFVIVQLVLFILHLTLDGLPIIYFRHTVMPLMVIGHTPPTVGIEFRDKALFLVGIGKDNDTIVLHAYTHIKQDTVDPAGLHVTVHLLTTGDEHQ